MSLIKIKKVSITSLDTDSIVNATNEGLRAGGGVSEAIFAAAGMKKKRNRRRIVENNLMIIEINLDIPAGPRYI